MTQEEKNELILLHRLWKSDALKRQEYVRYEYLINKFRGV
jgi:hypothetical protein